MHEVLIKSIVNISEQYQIDDSEHIELLLLEKASQAWLVRYYKNI